MNPRQWLQTGLRTAQVVFMVICLGGSAYWLDTFKKKFNVSPDPLGFAVFSNVTGLILSLLMILTPHKQLLNSSLPGMFDFFTSWIWSYFFLSIFSSLAGHARTIRSASFTAAVAMAFLLFVLFVLTALLALLDMRDGKPQKERTAKLAAGMQGKKAGSTTASRSSPSPGTPTKAGTPTKVSLIAKSGSAVSLTAKAGSAPGSRAGSTAGTPKATAAAKAEAATKAAAKTSRAGEDNV